MFVHVNLEPTLAPCTANREKELLEINSKLNGIFKATAIEIQNVPTRSRCDKSNKPENVSVKIVPPRQTIPHKKPQNPANICSGPGKYIEFLDGIHNNNYE